jgi:hypothetical protein
VIQSEVLWPDALGLVTPEDASASFVHPAPATVRELWAPTAVLLNLTDESATMICLLAAAAPSG